MDRNGAEAGLPVRRKCQRNQAPHRRSRTRSVAAWHDEHPRLSTVSGRQEPLSRVADHGIPSKPRVLRARDSPGSELCGGALRSRCTTVLVPPWACCIRSKGGASSKWRSPPPGVSTRRGGNLQRARRDAFVSAPQLGESRARIRTGARDRSRRCRNANHYGFSLALFGRFDEAIAQIGRALELDPLSVRFQWNLASVFYQSGRYDDAIEHCRRALCLT